MTQYSQSEGITKSVRQHDLQCKTSAVNTRDGSLVCTSCKASQQYL